MDQDHEKRKLRKKFKRLRDQIPLSFHKSANREIVRRLFQIPELKKAKVIGIYLNKGSEVRTIPILKKLHALEKTVVAPRVTKGTRHLRFCQLKRGLEDCHLGTYDIQEPNLYCPIVPIAKIDCLIVPGILFDTVGYRIGYGGGYYDTLLKRVPNVLTIGLTYEKTFLSLIARSATDSPVQIVLTEKRVHRIKNLS